MNLRCLNDAGGWGKQLLIEAVSRGWNASLLDNPAMVEPGDYVFMRLSQERQRLSHEKLLLLLLQDHGAITIPSCKHGLLYEDKLEQTLAFKKWMPTTWVCTNKREALAALSEVTFPLVSKSRTGSASVNVRLLSNRDEAEREIRRAFSPYGLRTSHRLGEDVQRGYLIWQQFLDGNPHDYRVVSTGRQMMALKRFNRPDLPFASGSGNHAPVTKVDAEVEQVLETSRRFFEEEKAPWCGLDLVRDPDSGEWKILETTLGWKQSAYSECVYFGTNYRGADIWKVLCDEIFYGTFS